MPREYEAIRDTLRKEGYSMKDAKKHAAMIYNRRNPGNPLKPDRKRKKR